MTATRTCLCRRLHSRGVLGSSSLAVLLADLEIGRRRSRPSSLCTRRATACAVIPGAPAASAAGLAARANTTCSRVRSPSPAAASTTTAPGAASPAAPTAPAPSHASALAGQSRIILPKIVTPFETGDLATSKPPAAAGDRHRSPTRASSQPISATARRAPPQGRAIGALPSLSTRAPALPWRAKSARAGVSTCSGMAGRHGPLCPLGGRNVHAWDAVEFSERRRPACRRANRCNTPGWVASFPVKRSNRPSLGGFPASMTVG